MSATVVNGDSIAFPSDSQTAAAIMIPAAALDVEFANCECCGLTEECTLEYIERVRERFQGKWICGLCAEAVTDEIVRSGRLITGDEALSRHFNFCGKFRSSLPPPDPTIHLIAALKQLLRKSFDSPKLLRSMPCSPTKSGTVDGGGGGLLIRSESCMPSLTLVDKAEFCAMELQEDCR